MQAVAAEQQHVAGLAALQQGHPEPLLRSSQGDGTRLAIRDPVDQRRRPVPRTRVQIAAGVDQVFQIAGPGRVVVDAEVIENEGVVVETAGTFIQGIFGIGGETHGTLRMAVESPDEELTGSAVNDDAEGAILVGGSRVSREVLEQAVKAVEGVSEVTVELVWEPPWSQDRMSDEARLSLGLF